MFTPKCLHKNPNGRMCRCSCICLINLIGPPVWEQSLDVAFRSCCNGILFVVCFFFGLLLTRHRGMEAHICIDTQMNFTRVASFWSGGTPRKLQQHSATPTRGSMMRFGWLPTYGCHVVLIYGIFAHFFCCAVSHRSCFPAITRAAQPKKVPYIDVRLTCTCNTRHDFASRLVQQNNKHLVDLFIAIYICIAFAALLHVACCCAVFAFCFVFPSCSPPRLGALKCKFGKIKVNGPSEWQAATGEESLQWEMTFIAVSSSPLESFVATCNQQLATCNLLATQIRFQSALCAFLVQFAPNVPSCLPQSHVPAGYKDNAKDQRLASLSHDLGLLGDSPVISQFLFACLSADLQLVCSSSTLH